MKAGVVRKLYPNLDGAERFRLVALALSRGDFTEVEHLIGSAPRVDVVARDLEFVGASKRFVTLYQRFDRTAAPMLSWLVLLDVIGPVASNVIGKVEGTDGTIYADLLEGFLYGFRRQALSELKALLLALEVLGTEQLGMGAETILAVPMVGCAALLERYRDAINEAEVSPRDVASIRVELDWSFGEDAPDALP